ncbi:MAG: 16S rRNA (adenine(1518)-N(6)/adenine(1519)-N(6))-dimethyltransferase RsmA [Chloroflexota bacterium]
MNSVRSLIHMYGLNPKRSLGQNFLTDESHLDRIIHVAQLTQDDSVLEVGPGLGGLTRRLAERTANVVGVELDDRLIELLRIQFANQPHVRIVHADILSVDPESLFQTSQVQTSQVQINHSKESDVECTRSAGPPSYRVVANLPYYITSAVLRHLLEAKTPPTSAIVMVQKEVAERICAKPGKLSILGVSIQFYAEPTLLHHVPAGAFYPRPKVDSAVLNLSVYPQPRLSHVVPSLFFRIVKAGFSQKRKQLLNSLSAGLALPKPVATQALEQSSIDPRRRAESLAIEEWGQLYDNLAHLLVESRPDLGSE